MGLFLDSLKDKGALDLIQGFSVSKDVPGFEFVVKMPEVQLDRKTYLDIKKALEGIGGKWNRKAKGFVFKNDPSSHFGRVQKGEKIDIKKEFQFFETPSKVADKMARMLFQGSGGGKILEPSAGTGSLIKAVLKKNKGAKFDVCEIMPENRKILEDTFGDTVKIVKNDFLKLAKSRKYGMIISNPPFTKNQDVYHVSKMISHLKSGGRVVSIMSPHFTFAKDKPSEAFRELSDMIGGKTTKVGKGAFKESGTMVSSIIFSATLPKRVSKKVKEKIAELLKMVKAKASSGKGARPKEKEVKEVKKRKAAVKKKEVPVEKIPSKEDMEHAISNLTLSMENDWETYKELRATARVLARHKKKKIYSSDDALERFIRITRRANHRLDHVKDLRDYPLKYEETAIKKVALYFRDGFEDGDFDESRKAGIFLRYFRIQEQRRKYEF